MILIDILLFIGLGVFLTWYLLSKDKGEREPATALWAAFGFGALGMIPAVILEAIFVPDIAELKQLSLIMLVGMSLLIGVIEEVSKFLPLALFIYKKRYFNEYTDGILYFALAGLGFGLPENIFYTLQFGGAVGLGRIIFTPFFHAATTAIVGYALIRAKLGGKGFAASLPTLGLMVLVHGLYDFGLLSGRSYLVVISLAVTAVVSTVLFLLISRAKRLDQQSGLSVVGTNTFCRSCGAQNPEHLLYCTKCGRRA